MADLYLIDASVFVFRAYFGVQHELTDRDGHPTNAVFGFTGFLMTFLEQVKPEYAAVAFDESLESSFRNDIYADYKANRSPAPLELKRQFVHCRAVAEGLGLDCFSDDRYEADDLIGTLTAQHPQWGHHILTSDKDLAQLLRPGDSLWDFARRQRTNYDQVGEKFGVKPEQIADFLALTGDSVDNIPGVPGIGPKSAAALLQHFETLDALLERAAEVEYLSLRGAKSLAKKLRDHAADARLARELTGICREVPLPPPAPTLKRRPVDLTGLNDLFDYLDFGQTLRQRAARLR